jgi:antitoxin component of RelBE/YafQ-DinJ toxin-antitoxin module
MTTQMIVRLDPELKAQMQKLARAEGKTSSQVVRELVENYVTERDMPGAIDQLWDRIGGHLRSRGVKSPDISTAIKEVRAASE